MRSPVELQRSRLTVFVRVYDMRIHRISLPFSNVFLIRDRRAVLVDTGCRSDSKSLYSQLDKLGVKLSEISLVVLTHAHFDHCGCAAELQKSGIPLMACSTSQEALSNGLQEGAQLRVRGKASVASLAKRFGFFRFPPVLVDLPISEECSLEHFGVDGRVLLTPGHTESSLSIALANESACVGDLLMGGYLGLPPAWVPNVHPASSDLRSCVRHVRYLRAQGTNRFFVGHGDVLEATAVDSWLLKFRELT